MKAAERVKAGAKAYRISYPFSFKNGRSVPRSDYYETSDRELKELLAKCKPSSAVEVPVRDTEELPQLAPEPSAEGAPAAVVEPQRPKSLADMEAPDWDYQTIPNLRRMIDAMTTPDGARLTPPSKSSSKDTCSSMAKAAWLGGARPHPLYGVPGGPQPTSGLPVTPPQGWEFMISVAEEFGIPVPAETREALAAYRAKLAEKEEAAVTPEEPAADPAPEPEPVVILDDDPDDFEDEG